MAAVAGMPIICNPLDFGSDVLDFSSDMPDDDFYRASSLIEQTIHQYRPNGDRRVPADVQGSIILRPNATGNEAALCRLIQATARILSFKRASQAGFATNEEEVAKLLEVSAVEIFDIVENYDILPIPLVPYSVSLTFSVFIKYFNSTSSRDLWKRACTLLDSLADTWWAAEAMSSMGRSIFEKLENEPQAAIDSQLGILGDDAAVIPGFFDQADIFGEFDKSVVNYWFPADQSFT
jgi:hypothetical protein